LRLADAEARLKALEEKTPELPQLDERKISSEVDLTVAQNSRVENPPTLHTAAGFKMLLCWPRIRLNLTIPGVSAATYLRDADDDEASFSIATSVCIRVWQVLHLLDDFYTTIIPALPVPVAECFQHCPSLSAQCLGAPLQSIVESQNGDLSTEIDLHNLSLPHLLVLSMALRAAEVGNLEIDPSTLNALSEATIGILLLKSWELFSATEELKLPIILLTAFNLVYFWIKPFHALGMLQSIDSVLGHFSLKHAGNP
jgi:hypothetical protein